jgi:hypothetical protein
MSVIWSLRQPTGNSVSHLTTLPTNPPFCHHMATPPANEPFYQLLLSQSSGHSVSHLTTLPANGSCGQPSSHIISNPANPSINSHSIIFWLLPPAILSCYAVIRQLCQPTGHSISDSAIPTVTQPFRQPPGLSVSHTATWPANAAFPSAIRLLCELCGDQRLDYWNVDGRGGGEDFLLIYIFSFQFAFCLWEPGEEEWAKVLCPTFPRA